MRLGSSDRSLVLRLVGPIAVAVLLASCGGSGDRRDEDGGSSSDESGPTEQTVEWEVVPEDPEDRDDPTQFTFGQEVKLVDGAVEPRLLAADIAAPIRITNASGGELEVRFTNPGWDEATTTTTGPLAPGDSFELDPIGVASITFEVVGTDLTGTIQVEQGLDTL